MVRRIGFIWILLALYLSVILPPRPAAADPAPGDACNAAQAAHSFQWNPTGNDEAGGATNALFCEGGAWKSIMTFQATTGNVGIGTLWPSQPLSVVGTIEVDSVNQNTGATFPITNLLQFGDASSGEGIGSKRNAGGNQYGLDFYTSNINRMVITSVGYLGIGNAAPGALLDRKPGRSGSGEEERGLAREERKMLTCGRLQDTIPYDKEFSTSGFETAF